MEEQHEQQGRYTEDALQLAFRAVLKMHKRCLRKEMDRRGLAKVGQPVILFMLRNHESGEDWDQKQYSEALGVSPATVAVSIKRMERAGLLSKIADPQDLRRNHLVITPMSKFFLCSIGIHKWDRTVVTSHGFSSSVLDCRKKCKRCGKTKTWVKKK